MASDPKSTTPVGSTSSVAHRAKGIRIFSYPKIIYFAPTMIVAFVCWIGMLMIHDRTTDPSKPVPIVKAADGTPAPSQPGPVEKHDRFKSPQNLFAVLFLGVFAFNLLMMGLDFPRWTIVSIIFLALFGVFFILWLGAAFEIRLLDALRHLMASIYAVANAEFYLLIGLIMAGILGLVYASRWLDYWEIMPNEILHHHGPLSDLERYPTTNLKFDKEIPDVLEHMFLGAGRLVLHVSEERKAIVLDNVLFINAIENALKSLMSRMEVRLTTDQEVADV
ncbi:MAG: hypothetical protein U0794_17335 [Isosphaeraceae bacterium]